MRRSLIVTGLLILAAFMSACAYIVLPEEQASDSLGENRGWQGLVTKVENSAGVLHVDLALRNNTADWSAFQTAPTATLKTADGKTTTCETVFVGTGGHRLAPGFQIRGYTTGTKKEPKIQPMFIECAGAGDPKGATLSFDFTYFNGWYNYYDKTANKTAGTMELNLDEVASDLTYPVGEPVDGLALTSDTKITALNKCVLTLTSVTRTDTGLDLKWVNTNPGEYPSYVHIGRPPVVGTDGILYGLYESPDIASVPVSQPGKASEWVTSVAVPKEVGGLYVLVSVESKQQRLFANYLLDITEQ